MPRSKLKIRGALFVAFCLGYSGIPGPAFADGLSAPSASDVGFFPPAHELFRPLLADPRELQYATRLILPVSRKLQGEAAMGDYLGLYRWATPWADSYVQWSVGGGIFGLFDLASTTDDLLVADFYANMPIDFNWRAWSFRFMPYHTSSHLGDDYLKETGGTTQKHSWDNLKWVASYEPWKCLRLYGAYDYVLRTLPEGLGRNGVQTGFEWRSPEWAYGHAQTYWANDLQSWSRTQWNPDFNSQLGVKLTRSPENPRSLSVFMEFRTGHMAEGQLFLNQQTYWGLGVRFGLT